MDIKAFQEYVKSENSRWSHTPETRVLYLMSEVGELSDEVLNLLFAKKDTTSSGISDIEEQLAMEIYDVIWNAVDLANQLNIDLSDAFEKKQNFNKNRWD